MFSLNILKLKMCVPMTQILTICFCVFILFYYLYMLFPEHNNSVRLNFQVPKIAVPLNTTKYNPSLDDNLTLISSFNKFPYPTQAELSWLTAVSKHPEEQIKVWFTTQRLKQGISWSPEEVGIIILSFPSSMTWCYSNCCSFGDGN